MYRPWSRNHRMRKRPKELKCHQCGTKFIVKCFREEANCPFCSKKHVVATGVPTPYKKIRFWRGKRFVELSKDLYPAFKTDPLSFGFEIGMRNVPLLINPYLTQRESKLYEEGKLIGMKERGRK